jgi:hypothetical protein
MDQQPPLSLSELLASLNGLTYIQLYYLTSTTTQIMPDEQAAMQLIRNRLALSSEPDSDVSDNAEISQAPNDQTPMGLIVKSVLKLSQNELQAFGDAVLSRLKQLSSPFPKRNPETHTGGISYSLSQVFPDEKINETVNAPTETPEWVQQIRSLKSQAFQTWHTGNVKEGNRLMSDAISLAEQNGYPTFALKIDWEGVTRRDEQHLATLFQEAVEFYRTQNDPFELAQKLRDWAFLQARIENRKKALEILQEAEAILESLTPEALSQKQSKRVLFQNLIENEVLIRTKLVDIERLREQILSGDEVRGSYSIGMI